MNIDPEFGSGWGDWTREKEDRRHRSHEEWLRRTLGSSKREWPWGKLWAGYDGKGSLSLIVVRYRGE